MSDVIDGSADIDTLRAMCLLCGVDVIDATKYMPWRSAIKPDPMPWAVVAAGTFNFAFVNHKSFYACEREALVEALKLVMIGSEKFAPARND